MTNGLIRRGVNHRFFAATLAMGPFAIHIGVLPKQARIFQTFHERGG
jgi:hypothetical protein